MHPVIVSIELSIDLTVLRELPGDRLPKKSTLFVNLARSSKGVKERPIVITFVTVIRPVHARPFLTPNKSSIRTCVALLENRGRLIYGPN